MQIAEYCGDLMCDLERTTSTATQTQQNRKCSGKLNATLATVFLHFKQKYSIGLDFNAVDCHSSFIWKFEYY